LNIHGRGYLCLKIAALYKPKKRFKNRVNTARRGESPSATSASQPRRNSRRQTETEAQRDAAAIPLWDAS
jgi:hypothetical protein